MVLLREAEEERAQADAALAGGARRGLGLVEEATVT